jgi:hypothetical protein
LIALKSAMPDWPTDFDGPAAGFLASWKRRRRQEAGVA